MVNGAAGDIVVVCGLAAEARIVAGPGVRTVISGGRTDTLPASIAAALDERVVGLVSFGYAGALSSSLAPGALLVADGVITDGELDFTDDRWTARLATLLPDALIATIVGSDVIAANPQAKRALASARAGVAVDMETHVVARVAMRRGLPFVVLRAISDTSDRSLPPAATVAMRADGGIALGAVMRSIARKPGQLPALIGLARDTGVATRALRRAVNATGARLAFD